MDDILSTSRFWLISTCSPSNGQRCLHQLRCLHFSIMQWP